MTDGLPTPLPESAREIAEVIGVDGLQRLVQTYGGTCIRIPGRHGLERVLTPSQYREFTRVYRGLNLYSPRLPGLKRRRARLLAAQGWTRAAIARELQVAERTVYQWLSETDDARQPDLFPDDHEEGNP